VIDSTYCHTGSHAYQGYGHQHRRFFLHPVSATLPFVFQRCLPVLRTLGAAVGITVGDAIVSNVLQQLRGIQGLNIDTSVAALNDSVRKISSIRV
jgi:hypothetical protein